MRIVIDLQAAQTESRFLDIGHSSLSLAQAMARNRGDHEIFIALNGLFPDTIEPIRTEFDELLPQENIRIWHTPGPIKEADPSNATRHKVAERIREAFLVSLQPDVVLISNIFEGGVDDGVTSIGVLDTDIPTAVAFFDLTPLLNPRIHPKPFKSYKKRYLKTIRYLKKANIWLTISELAENTVHKVVGNKNTSTVNISTACDPIFHKRNIPLQQEKKLFLKRNIQRQFILYVCNSDERKNINCLFRAFANMPAALRNTHQLVITGTVNIELLIIDAQTEGLTPSEIIFTGRLSNIELSHLYNLCTIFVSPPWHEGSGSPVLEAMSCGAAVIGSNTSSLHELIEYEDALFSHYSAVEITKKMVELLSDDASRINLSNHCLEQAKKLTWDKRAQRTITELEKLCNTTSRNNHFLDNDIIIEKLINSISLNKTINPRGEELASIAHAISISIPVKRQKQLFVDISELCQRDSKTGVQRVTRSVLNELLIAPPSGYTVEPVYATISGTNYKYARQFTAQFKGNPPSGVDEYIEYQIGDIFLGVDLQHHITKTHAHILTSMHQQGIKIYFVVYDLLPIQFPHYWPPTHSTDLLHTDWVRIISQFDGALCISRTVADELTDWLKKNGTKKLRPYKISWFHLGSDTKNSVTSVGMPADANMLLKRINEGISFLMVGTIEPRKGHALTLKAFEKVWTAGSKINLIIVGKQGWMMEDFIDKLLQHSEFGKQLFWIKEASDEYLDKIYTASTCLIAASEGEGFGLPLIEAAQHNLPIIARDIPVFREVAKEHATYFDETNTSSLTITIQEWLKLYKSHQHLRSDFISSITWKQSTNQILKNIGVNSQ